jgi:hypothetical protein
MYLVGFFLIMLNVEFVSQVQLTGKVKRKKCFPILSIGIKSYSR